MVMRISDEKEKLSSREAGNLITVQVPLISKEKTIGEVKDFLFEKTNELETINYIYVSDKNKKLIGVFSVKEVFRKPEETKIADIMEQTQIKCRASTHQERVAMLALRNNLKAIPVVDKEDKFLGVVTSDTILGILHQEHIEDILLAGGINPVDKRIREITTASAAILVKARLPWLLFGLLGGILAAQIIGFFEETLKNKIILALFIPVIVYISDAVATQTETLIIRGIAFDPKISLKNYFLREIKIGALLALILGGTLAVVSAFWWQETSLGIILGLAMFLSIFLSIIVAMSIPIILQKLKKDPAVGSGPIATIITDVISITTYFFIANLLLNII
jgi:magnesium transporter